MVDFGQGIPKALPNKTPLDETVPHAPIRPQVLSESEKVLAVSNALRYFPKDWHQELAEEFLTELKEKPKSDVINELTKIKGIGIWTAQMFLMSGLKNLDIFAPNDSGLMKGIRIVYFNNVKPKQANVEEITSKWIPFRTIGSWYMWQVANNN